MEIELRSKNIKVVGAARINSGVGVYEDIVASAGNLFLNDLDKIGNVQLLHIQIRNFKKWRRGVYSYCDKEYFQTYIVEYFFHYNRRYHRQTMLDRFSQRCVELQHTFLRLNWIVL